ncbi:MAG: HEPN domain-containing protein [Acidobacteriota bacterium]
MKNRSLADDYLTRAAHRLAALEVLFERRSWADVVRESQEVVELALKALLRFSNIETPRVHDVGGILRKERDKLPKRSHPHLERFISISKDLRRDRELAFYGSEDLTPSEFYDQSDAQKALEGAKWLVEAVGKIFGSSRK